MSDQVTFGDPPPPRNRPRYDWEAIAAKVKRRPGKWAMVFENDRQSLSVAIRQSNISALLPENGFEIQTRNNRHHQDKPRTCDLWVRYVPEKDRRKK